MKNKRLLVACIAFVSCACLLSAYANTMDIQDDCDGHGSIYPALYEHIEAIGEAANATLHTVMQYVAETFESTGEHPSGEAIQAHVLTQDGTLSQDEVEDALNWMSEQTSLGNKIPVPAYRIISLVLLGISYNYPEAWPVTLLFLLDADWVLPNWIYHYFSNGLAKLGLTGLYYGVVIRQFEQFQREFRRYLSKYGNNIHEYWMPITGTIFALYKYNERARFI